MRGTPNSRSFASGADATVNEQAYWDFSVSEIGEFDVQAMVKKVYEDYWARFDNTCHKVQLVGHSLATTEILISLAKSTQAAEYVSNAVLLAPCPIPSTNDILNGTSYSDVDFLINESASEGIYSLFGPNWADQLANVYCFPCSNFFCTLFNPLSTQCGTFSGFNVGPVADGTTDEGSIDEIGLKLLRHVSQLAETNRF